jgi:hypothetical protein
VDLVGERVAALQVHAGDHTRQRLGDVVEGVVIVVQDDHQPVAAEALVGTGDLGSLNGRG